MYQLLPPAVPHPLNLQIDQLLPFAVPPATYKSISYSHLLFDPLNLQIDQLLPFAVPPQPANRSSPTICCAPLNLQIDQLLSPAVPHPLNLQIDQLLPFAVPPATYKSISYSYLQFAPLQPTNVSAPPTCCAPPPQPTNRSAPPIFCTPLNLQIYKLLPPAV